MKYRTLYSSLAISTFVLLGACSQQAHYTGGAELERSTVTMVRLAHPVMAEPDGSAALSNESTANLENFSITNNIGYGDVVLFDQGSGVSGDRIEALTLWFQKKGTSFGEADGIFGAMPAAGNITIYVERHIAELPDCQRWSRDTLNDTNNASGQPFGCTSQSNLAAMIADPKDLITGERGSTSPNRTTKAVQVYRTSNGITTSGGGNN